MPAQLVEIDPYRQWLGIQDADRPLNAYQVLGLKPLEADQAKIRAGYQRQLTSLVRIEGKADPKLWEEVQREVEQAFALLIDAEQKAMLDGALRRRGVERGVSAPSPTAPAVTVTCRNCAHGNPSARRFCGKCGESLWEKCPQCGAESPADERYCGACGTDIATGLAKLEQQCRERLTAALALAEEQRFEAALSALRGIAAIEDRRLEKWAERALAEVARVEAQREEQTTAAAQALEKARRHLDNCEFELAQTTIESVPPLLRSGEHVLILERAVANRRELLILSGEIRAAVEQKAHTGLLSKLERLLTLKPNHAQARKMAEQLRDSLVKAARSKLAQHKYREALDTLQQLPAFLRSDEVASLAEEACELESLLQAIRGAPLANRQLLALADRFCKLAPTNPESADLKARISERCQSKPADVRLGAPSWAPPPTRPRLGFSVDWLAHWTQPEIASDAARQAIRNQPGELFTALGLALECLGLGSIQADLTPQKRTGFLAKLPSLPFGGSTCTQAWGIDLGPSGVRALKVSRNSPAAVKVEACEWIPHAEPLTDLEEARRCEVMDLTMKELAKRMGDMKRHRIGVAMPGHRVLGRFVELPATPAKKLDDLIQYEAKHQFPVPLEDLCWSYHLQTPRAEEGVETRRLLLQAARSSQVRDWIAIFQSAGITVDVVQSDAVALYHAIAFEFFGKEPPAAAQGATAILDLKEDSANLVICAPQSVWFRTFGQGRESIVRELVRRLNVTQDQAESLLLEPHRAPRFAAMQQAVQGVLVQLTSEVGRSLDSYNRLFPDQPVQRMYGLGAAISGFGILRQLRG